MKNLKTLIILFVLSAFAAQAQTALSATTLGAAVTTTTQTTITLASTSTMLAPGPANRVNTVLYVDKERMDLRSVTDSTHVVVDRHVGIGASAMPTLHANGATVYFSLTVTYSANFVVPAPSFFSNGNAIVAEVSGACTRTSELVVPKIYLYSGDMFDCMGGNWTMTNNRDRPTFGAVVASPAGLLTPTGTTFHVSGTNAITGIVVPAGWAPGMELYIVPDGAFTWTTATNISLAGTAVANKVIVFVWDGTKWNPSVVA
jgi:hypothetical protein